MKSIFFLIVLFLIASIIGCKKSSTNKANSWTLGNKIYTASVVIRSNYSLSAIDTVAKESLSFAFSSLPSVGTENTYLICDTCNNQNTSSIYTGEYPIIIGTSKEYRNVYYKNTMIEVKVSTNGLGKVSVTFPGKLWVYNFANTNDSLQLSVGTITEQ